MLQLKQTPPHNGKHHSGFPSESQFDAVLFDLFDTLIIMGDEHKSYIQSLKKTHRYLSRNGLSCSFEMFKHAYFRVVDRIYAETAVSLEEPHFSVYIERTINRLNPKLKDKTFLAIEAVNEFSKEFKNHLKIDPQSFEVLKLIRRNYKTGVISNLSFSECAWDLLEEYKLKQFLDVIVVSGDVNLRKPHPQIFKMALKFLNIKPSKALFVGDTLETDIAGSKRAGMTAVHIKRQTAEKSAVESHLAITELKQLLPMCGIELDEKSAMRLDGVLSVFKCPFCKCRFEDPTALREHRLAMHKMDACERRVLSTA
jgi:HAD superfamily hydrolase (TIGR01549 family)